MLVLGSDILANRYIADLTTLSNNSWSVINAICKAGAVPSAWVEQTKTFTGTDGNTYTLRLSDATAGRYTFSDNTQTHAVFELVECIPTSYAMNSSSTNAGGFGSSAMLTTLNSTVINILPSEITSILQTTTIKSDNGGGSNYSAIVDVSCKLFLPCATEVGLDTTTYGREGEGTIFSYYSNHAGNTYRKKAKVTTPTTYIYWWLRSSYPTSTIGFSTIDISGSGNNINATSTIEVAFCFAL